MALLQPHAKVSTGLPTVDSGSRAGRGTPRAMMRAEVEVRDATIADVTRKVQNREYAMVITEFDEPYFCSEEILKKNYDKEEQIDYYTYFGHSPVRIWRPKPRE